MKKWFLALLFAWAIHPTHAEQKISCLQRITRKVFTNEELEGATFLYQRNQELAKEGAKVLADRAEQLTSPNEKVALWMKYLDSLHKNADPLARMRIKNYYLNQNVIKESEIPQSYYELQKKIAREQGHGNITLDAETKSNLAKIVIEDQKSSLATWLDYMLSPNTNHYPMWAKHWAFNGMLKMGRYDPVTQSFANRGPNFVGPYPELNQEALAIVMDGITNKVHKRGTPLQDEEFAKLLEGANFAKLYTHTLKNLKSAAYDSKVTTGEWKKFNRGSAPDELVATLACKNTGWCTAGASTAKEQLENGDFYVYYSHDTHGEATIPRIAMRMEGSKIAEVRGTAGSQNLDSDIAGTPILKDKLKEFGSEGELYLKRAAHMNQVTEIEKKIKAGEELNNQELRFLYEIDEAIEGFGNKQDSRIKELQALRDIRADIIKIFEGKLKPEEISFTKSEALKGGIKFHYGDLDLDHLKSANGLQLPQYVHGSLHLNGISSPKGLILPEHVGGDIYLNRITSTKWLMLPKHVGGVFFLYTNNTPYSLEFLINSRK